MRLINVAQNAFSSCLTGARSECIAGGKRNVAGMKNYAFREKRCLQKSCIS